MRPVEGGWQAHNPAQQWMTTFDGRGFVARPQNADWTWGLELRGYGAGDERRQLSGSPHVKASGNRLAYHWDRTVQEWFVNDGRGLEHGFNVQERPPGPSDAPLTFVLATRGLLRAKVTGDARSVEYLDADGRTVLTYAGLRVWDAEGRELDSRFVAAEGGVELRVNADGARYPLTIDPIAQQATLKPSNQGASQGIGSEVAVSGDTVVIGNLIDASNAGAAYVFVRNGTTWTQQAYLKASNTQEGDQFGCSVAVSADTVVVGAQYEDGGASGINGNQNDNSARNSGAAYVFVRDGTTWTQQAYLKSSNASEVDIFGSDVAISGDTVVVGASGDGTGEELGGSSGAAYVFVRDGTTWAQQARLRESNTRFFGTAVAVSGDTVVVGVPVEDASLEPANQSSAAFVYFRNSTIWTQQARLKGSNTERFDEFGTTVAVSGDTAVVGAYMEASNATGINGNQADNSAIGAGAAYVFVRNGTTWTQQAYLKASNTEGGDVFGSSVAVAGDTVVVAAPSEDSNATGVNGNQGDNSAESSGAAYLFVRRGTNWTQEAYLKASNHVDLFGTRGRFGNALAVSGGTVVVLNYTVASVFTPVRQPVVLIHGVAGSVLKTSGRSIWPSLSTSDVEALHLVNGPGDTEAVDVVRSYAGSDAYGPFIDHMVDSQGYVEFAMQEDRSRLTNSYMSTLTNTAKPDLFLFPYDWRRSNASHAPVLHAYLQNISNLHGGAKVNLVVHSMGGLVMRRYVLDYGTDLIGRVVTVASPLWGAPESAYRMLTGLFFPLRAIDLFNSSAMKESVLSMPGVHELNPSPRYYETWGFPVFTEEGLDYDENGIKEEGYTADRFRTVLDEAAYPQTPGPNNVTFHNYLGGRQDDWSADTNGIQFLHIIGKQAVDRTTVGIRVRPKTVLNSVLPTTGSLLPPIVSGYGVFERIYGEGDGTVPTLGSTRQPSAYAPNTQVRVITEPLAGEVSDDQPEGQAAEHTAIMANTNVWNIINTFLETGVAPSPPAPASARVRTTSASGNLKQILVTGCGRVTIRDARTGVSTEAIGEIAVRQIPGVEVVYNEEAGWVLITFDADREIVIESMSGQIAGEVEVLTRTPGGDTIDMTRYRSVSGDASWQLALTPGEPAALAIDSNRSGTFETQEQVAPEFTADGPNLDMTPPGVQLLLSLVSGELRLAATGTDTSAFNIRYQINDSAVATYSTPIHFPRETQASIAVYAEDAQGNTSGLIRTRLNPQLSLQAQTSSTFELEWPEADGYQLQTASSLDGPWTNVPSIPVISGGRVTATVTPGDNKAFYRLAAYPVTK